MTGQNMGAVRNGQNVENMITKIIKLWYDEKKFIQQADGMFMCEPGKKCGHYIEVSAFWVVTRIDYTVSKQVT